MRANRLDAFGGRTAVMAGLTTDDVNVVGNVVSVLVAQ
jgi:hypothetical protein